MDFRKFDSDLANALQEYNHSIKDSPREQQAFKTNPTSSTEEFLKSVGIEIPELFHAHAIEPGDALPSEPERATRDRYIYIFRESGLFEFKIVPGSPTGDDSIMTSPNRACCCCNCCVMELPK